MTDKLDQITIKEINEMKKEDLEAILKELATTRANIENNFRKYQNKMFAVVNKYGTTGKQIDLIQEYHDVMDYLGKAISGGQK